MLVECWDFFAVDNNYFCVPKFLLWASFYKYQLYYTYSFSCQRNKPEKMLEDQLMDHQYFVFNGSCTNSWGGQTGRWILERRELLFIPPPPHAFFQLQMVPQGLQFAPLTQIGSPCSCYLTFKNVHEASRIWTVLTPKPESWTYLTVEPTKFTGIHWISCMFHWICGTK